MPYKPKKIIRPWVVKAPKFNNPDNKFYQSAKWKKFSQLYKDKHPLCCRCEAEGRVTITNVTDHIVRIQDGGEPFAESNLQPLCTSCHSKKSISERFKKK